MGKWQLLDYPHGREVNDVFTGAVRRLLADGRAYLLHDQVVFALTMDTQDQADGDRERFLILQPVASLGEIGHWELGALSGEGPIRSSGLRLPVFDDIGASEQVAGLLTEREGQAFLEHVHDQFHK